jgi:hypothetical protein
MTEKQKLGFYLPAWRECAAANGWVMRGRPSRLEADLEKQEGQFQGWPEPAGPLALKVVSLARQLAAQEHRGINAEDLRHGCNLVATGKPSSKHLNNKETNRVATLLKLLKDPDDLDAVLDWLHPENVERRSFVSWLRKQAPAGTLVAICRNAFATVFWEDLEIQKLRWLARQVKGRGEGWRRPVEEPF